MPAFVVAHFDPAGRVARDLFELVRALPGEVVFVSTGLSDSEAKRMGGHAKVLVRPNVGFDFSSYRMGIESLGPSVRDLDGLVILNSSFVTVSPARLLGRFLARFDAQTQLLGITRSSEAVPHLQSYWLGFGPRVVRSEAFAHWWSGVQPLAERRQVIQAYELGLSQHFSARGFALEAAFEPGVEQRVRAMARMIDCPLVMTRGGSSLAAAMAGRVESGGLALDVDSPLVSLNPTHFLWDFLLAEFGIVKLELLKSNPLGINLLSLRRMCSEEEWALVRDAVEPGAHG